MESKELQIKGLEKKTYEIDLGTKVTVKEGTSVLLKCPVDIYGPVDYIWKKDGKPLPRHIRVQKKDLLFDKLVQDDSADYTCYSDDKAAIKFGTTSLNVISKYSIKVRMNKIPWLWWGGGIDQVLLIFSCIVLLSK